MSLFLGVEKFGVILTDNPWRFKNWSAKKHGAAAAHYSTMSEEELSAIPVGDWAAKNSVLMLWGCWSKWGEAYRVQRSWGFEERTGFPWVKVTPGNEPRRGVGFWTMSCSEPMFISAHGKPVRREIRGGKDKPIGLAVDDLPSPLEVNGATEAERVFWAPRGLHSKKPLEIHEWIEKTLDGPYLELFARRPRPGWTTWGYDTGYELGPFGVRRRFRPATRRA